jgi:molybdopterin molybdotransferase
MAKAPLLPVEEALAAILEGVAPTEPEFVSIFSCRNRTLAQDVASLRTQPPFATSAMDGYAVRAADIARPGARLRLIGTSAAGHRFAGEMGAGETVRIFTGAPLPAGADTILIQENASVSNDIVTPSQSEPLGRFVRAAGLDFHEGEVLLSAGTRIGAREISLAAAMNHAALPVHRRPRVAILATGDELAQPGGQAGPDQIIASNHLGVGAAVESAGGEAIHLGIAEDNFPSLEKHIAAARDQRADVLVTIGGASVGDHDLVQSALGREGMALDFWRIAMRPGKPLMFGQLGPMRIIGLPGNPVSSIVCALIFIQPLVRALSGDRAAAADRSEPAIAGAPLPANDERQDYLRAKICSYSNGLPVVVPHARQDSSMLSTLAQSDALLIRGVHAPALAEGQPCRILRLDRLD